MNALSDASSILHASAHALFDVLDAGAVVVIALVIDDDGQPAVAVGSTGTPNTTRMLAEGMPSISRQLLEKAAIGNPDLEHHETTFRIPTNEN